MTMTCFDQSFLFVQGKAALPLLLPSHVQLLAQDLEMGGLSIGVAFAYSNSMFLPEI